MTSEIRGWGDEGGSITLAIVGMSRSLLWQRVRRGGGSGGVSLSGLSVAISGVPEGELATLAGSLRMVSLNPSGAVARP